MIGLAKFTKELRLLFEQGEWDSDNEDEIDKDVEQLKSILEPFNNLIKIKTMNLTEEQKEFIRKVYQSQYSRSHFFDPDKLKKLFPEAFEQKPEMKFIDVRIGVSVDIDLHSVKRKLTECEFFTESANISISELKPDTKRDEELIWEFLKFNHSKEDVVFFLNSNSYKEFLNSK